MASGTPAALNALNLTMIRSMLRLYAQWGRPGSGVRCVVAFCAGGDVKSNVLSARAGDTASALEFFREEYTMNHVIGCFGVPHVALLDGIVMGGGAGAAMHGGFRVATERTLFAMPETAIGLFPDVGMMQLLAVLPGEVGPWLALTGARLKGHAVKEVGLATHYLPSAALPDLMARLRALGPAAADASAVAAALAAAEAAAAAAGAPPLREIARRRPLIDALFACGRGGGAAPGGAARVLRAVRGAAAGAEAEDAAWLRETQQQLERASPLSLAVTWEYMRRARAGRIGLADCLEADWALVCHFVAGDADYWEGVRARLIDKDETPAWKFAAVEDVGDADVERLLALPPGQRPLGLRRGGGGGGGGGGEGSSRL
ncbi:MAG: ClpP/crotonase-like domain-containing protein [Monoraphidium minutum]|nr:MAG: ClpP/crotonase-like domain-containing protein [Monoraphidium minutum]